MAKITDEIITSQYKGQKNYVQLRTNDDLNITILFVDAENEIVDILETTAQFVSASDSEAIERWIYDGCSPSDYEDYGVSRRAAAQALKYNQN